MLHRSSSVAAFAAALALSGTAAATTNVWDVDVNPGNGFGGRTPAWSNGSAGTIFAAWDAFNTYPSDPTPDKGSYGPTPQSVVELTGGAFLTGGNIYSFAVPTDFKVTLAGDGAGTGTRTVALRLESVGTEIDYSSVLLNGKSGTRFETYRTAFSGGQGGFEVESLWLWSNVAQAGSYLFDFNAAGSSLSLSQVAAYVGPVAAVPEPGTWALMAGGLVLIGVMRMRRTQA